MYSKEIENFINSRNYKLGNDDLLTIINPTNHPQITEIKYDPGSKTYFIATNDNYQFYFEAMPYRKKDDEKKLVRRPN